jgi:hypothetical protein
VPPRLLSNDCIRCSSVCLPCPGIFAHPFTMNVIACATLGYPRVLSDMRRGSVKLLAPLPRMAVVADAARCQFICRSSLQC